MDARFEKGKLYLELDVAALDEQEVSSLIGALYSAKDETNSGDEDVIIDEIIAGLEEITFD